MSNLKAEFDYYLAHQDELVKQYDGKFIVIKDQKIIGSFDDELVAINEIKKQHELGTFLVQLVSSGESEYTQTFHSRVAFR